MKFLISMLLIAFVMPALSMEINCFDKEEKAWTFGISEIHIGRAPLQDFEGKFTDEFLVQEYDKSGKEITAIGVYIKYNYADCVLEEIVSEGTTCKIKSKIKYNQKKRTITWTNYQKKGFDLFWEETKESVYKYCAKLP